MLRMEESKTYRTYAGFHKAFVQAAVSGRVLYWYGADHVWVLVLRPENNA